MTIKKFIFFFFVQAALLVFVKAVFFGNPGFVSSSLDWVLYMVVTAVVASAIVRRLGFINFLEAIFTAGLWTIADFIFDLAVTVRFTGTQFISEKFYWIGFAVLIAIVLTTHKKRHVLIRKEQRAEHGHH